MGRPDLRDVVPAQVRALKAASTGDLSLGGAHLAGEFFARGLLDELRLYIHPVVLGDGTRLFATAGQRSDLSLLETRRFANGVVLLHYAVESGA